MAIWLTQWKCPKNHTALAASWDDSDSDREAATKSGESVFERGLLNRWCGICGGTLDVEHAQTVFPTLEAIEPALKLLEAQNLYSRQAIDARRSGANLN